MKCIKCGKELKKDSIFCNSCGANQCENDTSNNVGLIMIVLVGLFIVIGVSYLGYMIFIEKNTNDIKDNIVYDDSFVSFDKYHIKILDGFNYFTIDEKRYLKNDYCTIEFDKYPLSLTQINNNKEFLIDSLKNNGYEIIDYTEDSQYLTIKANLKKVEYGLVFYTKDDITIFFKIVSNNLSVFDNKWFSYIKDFTNNMI